MKTYIIEEDQLENYRSNVLLNSSSMEEEKMKIDLMGLTEIDIEDAKRTANIGSCILIEYDGKLMPYRIVHKYENGNVIIESCFVSERHIFDKKTNVWKNSEIRKFMNNEMVNKYTPEFRKMIKKHTTNTDDYTTKDMLFLPSHEELGYNDKEKLFKPNQGAIVFDYYKQLKEKSEK